MSKQIDSIMDSHNLLPQEKDAYSKVIKYKIMEKEIMKQEFPLRQSPKWTSQNSMITTGLSMNILHAGNKLFMQRGFFKNSAGRLFPTLSFLGGLHNFCKSRWYLERDILQIWKWLNTTKKRAAEIASLRKLKTTQKNSPDTLR